MLFSSAPSAWRIFSVPLLSSVFSPIPSISLRSTDRRRVCTLFGVWLLDREPIRESISSRNRIQGAQARAWRNSCVWAARLRGESWGYKNSWGFTDCKKKVPAPKPSLSLPHTESRGQHHRLTGRHSEWSPLQPSPAWSSHSLEVHRAERRGADTDPGEQTPLGITSATRYSLMFRHERVEREGITMTDIFLYQSTNALCFVLKEIRRLLTCFSLSLTSSRPPIWSQDSGHSSVLPRLPRRQEGPTAFRASWKCCIPTTCSPELYRQLTKQNNSERSFMSLTQ